MRTLIGLLSGWGSVQTGGIYDVFRRTYPVLDAASILLFTVGILTLTAQVALPIVRGWRARSGAGMPAERRLISQILAVWRDVTAEPEWRKRALLWIWIATPLALLLRHSDPVTVHYLLFLAPGVFIVQGLGMCAILDGLRALTRPGRLGIRRAPSPIVSRGGVAVVLVLVGLLVVGDGVRWALYPASLVSGQFVAYDFYGFPLAEVQAADAQLSALEREQHASAAYVVTPVHGRFGETYDYIFANERPAPIARRSTCIVLCCLHRRTAPSSSSPHSRTPHPRTCWQACPTPRAARTSRCLAACHLASTVWRVRRRRWQGSTLLLK